MGKHKKKKNNKQTVGKRGKQQNNNNYRNQQRGRPQSKKDEIYNTLDYASNLTNSHLHNNRRNNYNDNYHNESNQQYNGNGGRKKGRNRNNNKPHNNHRNNNNKGNHHNNKWKPKGRSELNKFLDQLRPLGLGIRNAQSDGNCLFRAIADQISGDENNQAQFRKDIVDYMRKNSDEFAPFYVGDYDAYLKKMSKNGIWGGNMELIAAAKAFKVDIVIHSLGQPRYEILYQKGSPQRQIHLSYHNERHYASVRRLDDMRSSKPANKINLDATETEKLQREQQRAEIAWCHNGGNPLDIEQAKDELMDLTPAEQVVVAKTGCYDIHKVKQALNFLDNDIDAAVENIMVEISLMADENRKKINEQLAKLKEEEEKEKQNKKNGANKNNKKKKNKKHKHNKKSNNKGGNVEMKQNEQEQQDKDKDKEEEKKQDMDVIKTVDKEEDDEREAELTASTSNIDRSMVKSMENMENVDDKELEERLAKMQNEDKENKETVDKKDPFSVNVKIISDDTKTTNDESVKKEKTATDSLNVNVKVVPDDKTKDSEEITKSKEEDMDQEKNKKDRFSVNVQIIPNDDDTNEKKEEVKDIELGLDKKDQVDIKQDVDEFDLKYYEQRDARIEAERKSMSKVKCIECDYQNELLLTYLHHYKVMHLRGGKIKKNDKTKTKDLIECPCGHQNQSDFSFCSECGWDLRYKLQLPEVVKSQIQKENQIKKQEKQKYQQQFQRKKNEAHMIDPELQKKINLMTLGTIDASQLLNTGGKAIVIQKKKKQQPKKKQTQNASNNKPKAKLPPNSDKKFRKYLNKYWICKQCDFWNPKSNKNCMVCSMLGFTKNNNIQITKSNGKIKEDFPALPTTKNNNNHNNNKPRNKPKKPPQQKKKNQFGWICPACTMENKPAQQKCHMCNSPKPKKNGNNKPSNKPPPKGNWQCVCTLINESTATRCAACDRARPGGYVAATSVTTEVHDYDADDIKNELASYQNVWSNNNKNKKNQKKPQQKRNRGQDEEKKNEWIPAGGGKCPCGSGKKLKKCCKKVQKHQDKSYKNKFKNPQHQRNNHGYHNDQSYYGNETQNSYNHDNHELDKLNKIIDKLEYDIPNFRGKNAKQEKIKMSKLLDKVRKERDALYNKLEREKNRMIKVRNKQNQYVHDDRDANKNKKKRQNNNHNHHNNNNNNRNQNNEGNVNNAATNTVIAI